MKTTEVEATALRSIGEYGTTYGIHPTTVVILIVGGYIEKVGSEIVLTDFGKCELESFDAT